MERQRQRTDSGWVEADRDGERQEKANGES